MNELSRRFAGLTNSQLNDIHQTCEEFEQARNSSKRSSIEQLLAAASADIRDALCRELVSIEVDWQLARGESPDRSAYLRRFPDHADAIQSMFVQIEHEIAQTKPGKERENGQSESNAAEEIPDRVGRYRIDSTVGKGAFGIVYRAFDDVLNRPVAVKVPHPQQVRRPEDAKAYLAEARTVAILDHPNIVPVHDVGSDDEFPFFVVSKLIDGESLAARLKQRKFAILAAIELVATIAEALHHAHKQGIVHRDVKPGNILLDRDGDVHLVDFGLALHDDHDGNGPAHAGTAAYMSPEQARGEGHRVDGRSDVFSLGIVLYELVTGRRPFRADSLTDLLNRVATYDPRPVRQYNEEIPKQLERICQKAMSKRIRDRYETAFDMAEDLRAVLSESSVDLEESAGDLLPTTTSEFANSLSPSSDSSKSFNSDGQPIAIVPKGLRSFDEHDADFFLSLLPGPCDRHGLPESIRFWKSRIDGTNLSETFSVGLIYGPSGCGKSSFVKAGLLPRLANNVTPIYLEATADETESRLRSCLQKRFRGLPDNQDLKHTLADLRREKLDEANVRTDTSERTLIVIDQFEQWLHANKGRSNTELVQALRQCDGEHLQCIVIVRDDFWMAATRFMHDLEVPLLEGQNSNCVDLFPIRHGEKVLTAIGQAFGALPPNEVSDPQRAFVRYAVSGLTDNGQVICVRLAMFAQMMQNKTWSPEMLIQAGGATGLGVTFLEETFVSANAPPGNRYHQVAAQAVLKSLLPDLGIDIKGHMRSREELLNVTGYGDRLGEFEELLRILDGELRLITPTEAETRQLRSVSSHVEDATHGESSPTAAQYYQLTHDYLVPALRQWLTRKQQETLRGRAELCLYERSALWNSKPESRLLPTTVEFLNLRLMTASSRWTEPQRKMMDVATRKFTIRWGSVSALLVLAVSVLSYLISTTHHQSQTAQTKTAVSALERARVDVVPYAVEDLVELPRDIVLQELRSRFESATDARNKLALAFGLARCGQLDASFLVSKIDDAHKAESANFYTAFEADKAEAVSMIRAEILKLDEQKSWRAKARLAIVALHLGESSFATDMCRTRSDPIQQTLFIDEYRNWHGDTIPMADLMKANDASCQFAICLAMGSIDPDQLSDEIRTLWTSIFENCYRDTSASGLHGAADWALRQWSKPMPAIDPSADVEPEAAWFVNSLGMTMIRIPAGSFTRQDMYLIHEGKPAPVQKVTISQDFVIGDREVSIGQFMEFYEDPDCPKEDKPHNWPGAYDHEGQTAEHAAQHVNWFDSVLFCNWLSRKEGLKPCYKNIDWDVWRLEPDANGYRLPTEAEWELACRAGTTTDYHFGNDVALAEKYSVCETTVPEKRGSRLPNRWGLFDATGNVYEWCNDWTGPYLLETDVRDPINIKLRVKGIDMRSKRGGMYGDAAHASASSFRNRMGQSGRSRYVGFRVARSMTLSPRERVDKH